MDPFSGSGTVAVGCWEMNHDFIAVERDKDYHAASVKRLDDCMRQERLDL